jgi:hypothetical protein
MHPSILPTYDADLAWRVANSLRARGIVDLEQVEIKAAGGVIVVRGAMPTTQAKRWCIECCQHVAGVLRIIDSLDAPIIDKVDETGGDESVLDRNLHKGDNLPRSGEVAEVCAAAWAIS